MLPHTWPSFGRAWDGIFEQAYMQVIAPAPALVCVMSRDARVGAGACGRRVVVKGRACAVVKRVAVLAWNKCQRKGVAADAAKVEVLLVYFRGGRR